MNKLILNAQKTFVNNLKFNFGIVSNQHVSKDAEVHFSWFSTTCLKSIPSLIIHLTQLLLVLEVPDSEPPLV